MVPDLVVDPSWEAYGPFEAKWFAAMNDAAKENLIRHHGADPERIVVTGQPAFDKSHAPSVSDGRRYAAEKTAWAGARPYLVVATTWDQIDLAGGALGQANRADHAHAVVDVVRRLAAGHYDVIVKPHPSEPAGSYAAVPGTFVAPPDAELDPLIVGSEGLIAAGSTTSVVDGLSLGRPTVLVQLDGKEPLLPYRSLGVPVARAPEQVERWLAGLVDGAPPARADANTGAAARVAELVERLARGGAS
jgi:hypothetical protein